TGTAARTKRSSQSVLALGRGGEGPGGEVRGESVRVPPARDEAPWDFLARGPVTCCGGVGEEAASGGVAWVLPRPAPLGLPDRRGLTPRSSEQTRIGRELQEGS